MVLALQAALALLAFAAAAALFGAGATAPAAGYHLVFAVGILPLILAAMVHFVPVLTRSAGASPPMRWLPLAALAGGLLALLYFFQPPAAPAARHLGALLSAAAAAAVAGWAWRRRRRTLGAPHPCLDWYLAALACLLAGLGALFTMHWLPGQRTALRLAHLHLNTLGFIGISALGTLQVLLPTAAGLPDAGVAARMRRHLPWVVAGTLVAAGSAAWQPRLAWLGLALLAYPLAAIGKAWWQSCPGQLLTWHGAPPILAAALLGYALALALGAAHGLALHDASPTAAFLVAFLMPLVSGAAGHLLPVWLRPGRQGAWHHALRRRLERGSGARALALLAAGIAVGLGARAGWYVALAAMLAFVLQAARALTLAAAPPDA